MIHTAYQVSVADSRHAVQAESICQQITQSALARGTGIAGRTPAYLRQKVQEGKAVIATRPTGEWVGFAYLDVWEAGQFVSQSGLIVDPAFRQQGVAQQIKDALFALSRQLYPQAKLVSITTSAAVMRLNSRLGFRPVAFAELPGEATFWAKCDSCRNCDILARTQKQYCLCTALLFDPAVDMVPQTAGADQ